MHLFIFSIEKMYYLHKTASAVSCVKPNASQWEATLRDDVGFATVYRRIYRRKFLTLSNQTSRYIRECIRMEQYVKQQNNTYYFWREWHETTKSDLLGFEGNDMWNNKITPIKFWREQHLKQQNHTHLL